MYTARMMTHYLFIDLYRDKDCVAWFTRKLRVLAHSI